MDAFEQLVEEILWRDGYWVKRSVKVGLTVEEKKEIGRPTCPRWEIDIVAYKGKTNEILLVECKSYIDSLGVTMAAFDGSDERFAKRFKLFHDTNLFSVVSGRLITQLSHDGAINPVDIKPKLCLAAGHIRNENDRIKLHEHFSTKGWKLWDKDWLQARLKTMADSPYENSVASVTAKLILKGEV